MRKRNLTAGIAAIFVLGALLVGCQPTVAPTVAPPTAPPKAAAPQATAPQAGAPQATTAATAAPPKATAAAQATAKPAAPTPVKGGTLRVFTPRNPASLDPAFASGNDRNIVYNIYDSLVGYDADLKTSTANGLAESFEVAKDGLSVTFKLRSGIKFHDGTAFDAESVKFNLDRIQDPKTKSVASGFIDGISSTVVVDPLTVKINLKAPSAVIISNLAYLPGLIASPTAIKKYGEDYGRNPVGTGPFRMTEWSQGAHVTLQRSDGYWRQGLPYLDGIIYRVIADATVAAASLRVGDLDEVRGVNTVDLPVIEKNPDLVLDQRLQESLWGIALNNKNAPFDNKLVRQAVAWAIDRPAAGKAVFGVGGSEVISAPLIPGTWEYDASIKPYQPRDVAKAKALLAQAGYPNGLKTNLLTNTERPNQLLAQIYQQQLAEAGITVEIDTVTPAELTDKRESVQYTGMARAGMARAGDPASYFDRFTASNPRGGTGYGNPKIDELLDKARMSPNQQERADLYREIARIVADDSPMVFIYVNNLATAFTKRLQGYTSYPDSLARYHTIWLQK